MMESVGMVVKDTSEVSRFMASIGDAIKETHEEITLLAEALTPGLAPDTPATPEATPPMPAESPIAQALADRLRGIDEARTRIHYLRARVRL